MENDEIIANNSNNAEIMNNYFVNIAQGQDIPDLMNELSENSNVEFINPIDLIIHKYRNHPSILKLSEYIKPSTEFNFENSISSQIEKEILELNSKKATGSDAIPTKVLKDTVGVVKYPLTVLFNITLQECQFPSDLKYANVSPVFKKGDNTDKKIIALLA